MAKAVRQYEIIFGAQDGRPIEDFDPPLTKEEIETYYSTQDQVARIRATGREPIFELPIDAFDDEDGIEDIYSDDFDDDVIADLERGRA